MEMVAVLISCFAVVVSLGSFGHSRQTFMQQTIAQHFTWISSALLEHPGLRKYFDEHEVDPSDLSADDRSRLDSISEVIADTMDLAERLRLPIRLFKNPGNWIIQWRSTVISNSIPFREFVLEHKDLYHESIVSEVRASHGDGFRDQSVS